RSGDRSPRENRAATPSGHQRIIEPTRLRRLTLKRKRRSIMSAPREQAVINGKDTATTAVRTLQHYIGGRWTASNATQFCEVRHPVNAALLARGPYGPAADVDRAVQAAQKAYVTWRPTPPVQRVKPLWKLKNLLEQHFDDIARTITREHGKTVEESRSSVRR